MSLLRGGDQVGGDQVGMSTGVADYQTAVSDGGVAFHLNLFVKYIVNG